MKRGITVLVGVCLLMAGFYFGISKWGIEHQTLHDTTTGRPKPLGTRGARMADTVGASAPEAQ